MVKTRSFPCLFYVSYGRIRKDMSSHVCMSPSLCLLHACRYKVDRLLRSEGLFCSFEHLETAELSQRLELDGRPPFCTGDFLCATA